MMLISLTTIFCLMWRIKATDGRLTKERYQTVINSESTQDRHFLTTRDIKTRVPEGVEVYKHSKIELKMLDSEPPYKYELEDKQIHNIINRAGNRQPSLISSRKNNQLNHLFVTVTKRESPELKWPNIITRTKDVAYHRGRRNLQSLSSNESVEAPNVNYLTPKRGTVPRVVEIEEQTHPSSDQDNATETDKSRSDQNSSAAINLTNSISSPIAASSATIFPSLQHFDSSLMATSNNFLTVTNHETILSLQTGQVVQNDMTIDFVTPRTLTDEDVFTTSMKFLPVTPISSTPMSYITPSSRNIQDIETIEQTSLIQPTVIVASSIHGNTALFASLHHGLPLTSRTKSDEEISNPDEIWTAPSTSELLQTSLPIKTAAAPSHGFFSSSEITQVLITQLHNTDVTSNTPAHFMTTPSPSTATPSTSRPWSSTGAGTERAASRDRPEVVTLHDTSIAALVAHPSDDPRPIIDSRDVPELAHVSTTEAQVTDPNEIHLDMDGNGIEGKTTVAVSTGSQELSEHQENIGTSWHTTTDGTVKSTSSGNTTVNETDCPTFYMELKFGMSWPNFVQEEMAIRQELVDILQDHVNSVGIATDQIKVMDREALNCFQAGSSDMEEILVHMYLTNITHQFDRNLTLQCATILQAGIPFDDRKNSIINGRLLAINVYDKEDGQTGQTTSDDSHGNGEEITSDDSTDHRVTLAVALAVVGGCCCIGLIILQVVVRRRNKDNNSSPMPSINSSYSHSSSDSMQLASVIKSRPNSGLVNPGLDILEPPDPTHPLNFMQLSNFCMDERKIEEEYQKLPQRMPRPSMVPAGEEDKNRYSNILPLVHTRVKLVQDGPVPRSSYINANYVTVVIRKLQQLHSVVKGPNNQCQYYIATQAPTENTTADFWTMIWQQGCQTIVMLTDKEEQGHIKCASYWPELVGKSAAHKHGDFLIELVRKDVQQEYIASRLEINNQRKIETRQIDHFWYTCWPPHGLPEPISLVKLVLDVRPKYENGTSPLVVHCSPGTGRTCTFIALDLCMKQFETRRIVDVMKTVNSIRQERAGAIQNKEQYVLLYNAVHEYAAIVMTPGISATSSAATLQALLSS